jgi:DNA-binding GntR family transcriptional regulator
MATRAQPVHGSTRSPRPTGRAAASSPSAPSSAPAAPPTDADIHARLFEALLDQRLAPGTRLVEDELGRAFGVSRTRIRQVLIRLASEQLVTLVPNAGARVAEPTPDDAREVFDARRLLEPTLVARFAARATAADLRALQAWITDEEAARKAGERHEAIRMAGGFHLHIADHAGSATLARTMRELVSRTSLVLLRYGPQEIREPARGTPEAPADRARDLACDCHEHRTILAAVKLRDAAAAGRAMLQHLARLESQLDFDPAARAAPKLAELLGLPGG